MGSFYSTEDMGGRDLGCTAHSFPLIEIGCSRGYISPGQSLQSFSRQNAESRLRYPLVIRAEPLDGVEVNKQSEEESLSLPGSFDVLGFTQVQKRDSSKFVEKFECSTRMMQKSPLVQALL